MTRYVGKDIGVKKSFSFILLAITLILLILGGIFFYQSSPTGHVAIDVDSSYNLGEKLEGTLKLSLKSGELIPDSTLVTLRNGEQSVSIPLSELVSQDSTYGNFYADGVSISGEGLGFGNVGENVIYPEVNFQLIISNIAGNSDSGELVQENNTESENESTTGPTNSDPVNQIEEDNSVDVPGQQEDTTNNGDESTQLSEDSPSESSESDSSTDSGSSITGSVIADEEFTVSDSVSKGNDFTYNLEENQDVQIVSGSVKYNESELPENTLNLDVENGLATVSTEYSISNAGQDEVVLELEIDLSKFNISVEADNLEVELVYEDTVILSSETSLNLNDERTETNVSIDNETIIDVILPSNITINETNVTETNITQINQTLSILHQIANISTIRLSRNNSVSIDLSDYFVNAQSYIVEISNLTANVSGSVLNITTDSEFFGAVRGNISAILGNESVNSTFLVLVSSGAVNIETLRSRIVVGEPVQWIKNITLEQAENVSVELPAMAQNISVTKVVSEEEQPAITESRGITGNLINGYITADIDTNKGWSLLSWIRKIFSRITGNVIQGEEGISENTAPIVVVLADNATSYLVEYYTPAPEFNESNISHGKQVVISGPELNYTDIIASADVSDIILSSVDASNLKLYWHNYDLTGQTEIKNVSEVDNQTLIDSTSFDLNSTNITVGENYTLQDMPFDQYDADFDGRIDYIEWVVPHLSSQTFSIILSSSNTGTQNTSCVGNYCLLALNKTAYPYSSLAAYWSMDALINATMIADLSGNGLNMIIGRNDSVPQNRSGLFDNALHINGSYPGWNEAEITRVLNSSLLTPDSFTISLWARPTSFPSGNFYGFVKTGSWSFARSTSTDSIILGIGNATYNPLPTATGFSTNSSNWSHVVATYNVSDGNISLYVNGVIRTVSRLNRTGYSPPHTLMKIGYWDGAVDRFEGALDEIMLFNSSLSSQQIRDIYNNQSLRFFPQGFLEVSQFNISKEGDPSINLTLDDVKKSQNTNISARIGRWDPSQGYNDSHPNLKLYYHADNNATDSSGNANHGIVGCGGGACSITKASGGIYNGSFVFAGVQDYVNATSSITLGANFTVSVWVYPTTVSQPGFAGVNGATILDANEDGGVGGYVLGIKDTQKLWWWPSGSNDNYSSSNISLNAWTHVAMTYNGSTLIIYLNGTSDISQNALTPQTPTFLRIGNKAWITGFFNGSMDELMIFNKSLSSTEIKDLYVKGRATWDFTAYQNLTSVNTTRTTTVFPVKSTTTNILPSFSLTSNDQFYSPYLGATSTNPLGLFLTDLAPPDINFTNPTPVNYTLTNTTSANTIVINVSSVDTQTHHAFSSIDDDLALWLRFDTLNATGQPIDSSSYNSAVNPIGGATLDTNGKYGNAYRFYANGSYLRVKDNQGSRRQIVGLGHNVSTPYGITIAAWVYLNGTQNDYAKILERPYYTDAGWGSPYVSYGLAANRGDTHLTTPSFEGAFTGSYTTLTATTIMKNSTWYFIVGMYNGTHMSIFVNGTRENIATQTGPITAADIWDMDTVIGTHTYNTPGESFNGSIDEVMVFSRGLSEVEIKALYNASLTQAFTNYSIGVGRHTAKSYAFDDINNLNSTETRIFYTDKVNGSTSFVFPTSPNQSIVGRGNFTTNTTIADDLLTKLIFNLNGSNLTIFDANETTLFLNFDNRTAIGEDQNNIVDLSVYNNPIGNYDEAANGYNGFFMFNKTSGKYGNSYYANLSCNTLMVSNAGYRILPNNGSFSFAFWAYPTQLTSVIGVTAGVDGEINNDGNYGYRGFRAVIETNSSGQSRYGVWSSQNNGTGGLYSPWGSIVNNSWFHAVVTYNPNPAVGSAMYINGNLAVSANDWYMVPFDNGISLAGAAWGGSTCMVGLHDDIMIINRSISALEARQLYDSSLTKVNQTLWVLTTNQSNVSSGTISYQVHAIESSNRLNSTEVRTVIMSASANCSTGCIIVKNSSGSNKTLFDNRGNIDLSGTITQSSVGVPNGNDFIVRNTAGSVIAWIDGANGNMRLAGTLSTNQGTACTPPARSFVVRNTTGSCVSYIDGSGNLWLQGFANQNSNL